MIAGGGNPTGGQYTGPANLLEYYGEHALATSGNISCDNNETTLMEWTMNRNYLIGTLQFYFVADSSDDFTFRLYYNDKAIAAYTVTGGNTKDYRPLHLLVPAYTVVKATAQNVVNVNANDMAAIIVGRVYRD